MDTCGKGHFLDDKNTYIDPRGKRNCRECRRQAAQRFRDRDSSSYRMQHKKRAHKLVIAKPKKIAKAKKVLVRVDRSPIGRFLKRVHTAENGCWDWLGGKTTDGYGVFCIAKGKNVLAHRFSYIHHKGEILAELEIDHVCNNRCCVNPEHLEAVSHLENILRAKERGSYKNHIDIGAFQSSKTHCKLGHPYAGDNLVIEKHNGARRCKICEKAKIERYRLKKLLRTANEN